MRLTVEFEPDIYRKDSFCKSTEYPDVIAVIETGQEETKDVISLYAQFPIRVNNLLKFMMVNEANRRNSEAAH